MEVTEEQRRGVEQQVQRLLDGQGSEVSGCVVGLDQSKPAALKKNVSYIVCGVVFNEKEEVLMVQEAKPDCYKQWYLPAGRVELGESLEEALKREVKEEAGFDCEPISLLLIQEQGPQWIRFIFLAKITGGTLKSPAAADQESLQASWWDRRSPLPLRGRDILRLIDCGLRYHRSPGHPVMLPVDLSCRHVLQRVVLVFVGAEDQVWILLMRGSPGLHLPTAAALKTHVVTWAANQVVQEALPSSYYDHAVDTLGVCGVQHGAAPPPRADGVCLNTLVALAPDRPRRDGDGLPVERPPAGRPPPVESPRYLWCELQGALRARLLQATRSPPLVPIHSLY
ncbi:LOW QUALITY PROTEIN: 8-oxo-dGDP phosphatase NUDT18 [Menidia menidia]